MRLKQQLNEMDKLMRYPDINKNIKENCKEYLKLLGHNKDPLYRGFTSRHPFGFKDVRKDRKPYGMGKDEAKYLNDWLGKAGHARRDQSVLCSPDRHHVQMFGNDVHYIFPMDKIKKYTYIEAKDINIDDTQNNWSGYAVTKWVYESMTDEEKKTIDDSLVGFMKHSMGLVGDILKKPFEDHFHTNTGFAKAHGKDHEFWFDCKRYIYVRESECQGWDYKKQELIFL